MLAALRKLPNRLPHDLFVVLASAANTALFQQVEQRALNFARVRQRVRLSPRPEARQRYSGTLGIRL